MIEKKFSNIEKKLDNIQLLISDVSHFINQLRIDIINILTEISAGIGALTYKIDLLMQLKEVWVCLDCGSIYIDIPFNEEVQKVICTWCAGNKFKKKTLQDAKTKNVPVGNLPSEDKNNVWIDLQKLIDKTIPLYDKDKTHGDTDEEEEEQNE